MPYRDYEISHCRGCDRPRREGERFSARGKCVECGEGAMIENARQLAASSGPFFEHWRRRCAAAFGVTLVDDPKSDDH
jgi:hypothetical protein